MRKETLLQPLVPLVAAIIGGLIASTSAFLLQKREATLTERLSEEERLQERSELFRDKLEEALHGLKEIAVAAACVNIEEERRGRPARCLIDMEKTIDVGALVAVYADDLNQCAENVQESYFRMKNFLETQAPQAPITEWPEGQPEAFKQRMDAFDNALVEFANPLEARICSHLPPPTDMTREEHQAACEKRVTETELPSRCQPNT